MGSAATITRTSPTHAGTPPTQDWQSSSLAQTVSNLCRQVLKYITRNSAQPNETSSNQSSDPLLTNAEHANILEDELTNLKSNELTLTENIQKLEQEILELQAEITESTNNIAGPSHNLHPGMQDTVQAYKKELGAKQNDLRTQLKVKQEELTRIKTELNKHNKKINEKETKLKSLIALMALSQPSHTPGNKLSKETQMNYRAAIEDLEQEIKKKGGELKVIQREIKDFEGMLDSRNEQTEDSENYQTLRTQLNQKTAIRTDLESGINQAKADISQFKRALWLSKFEENPKLWSAYINLIKGSGLIAAAVTEALCIIAGDMLDSAMATREVRYVWDKSTKSMQRSVHTDKGVFGKCLCGILGLLGATIIGLIAYTVFNERYKELISTYGDWQTKEQDHDFEMTIRGGPEQA